KQKKAHYRKYKKTHINHDYDIIKKHQSQLKSKINDPYKKYIQKIKDDILEDPKNFWTYFRSKGKSSSHLPSVMLYNESVIDDPQIVVQTFAKFFSENFEHRSTSVIDNFEIDIPILYINCIEVDDVVKAIRSIKPSTIAGPDMIPAFLLKDCAPVLAPPLSKIFNLILKTDTFPILWKESRIRPMHKKNSKSEITNYRPITIMSNFAKIFEITIYPLIFHHVKNNIALCQHGFFSGRSTSTNLMCITQFISEVMDRQGQVDVVYADFSKAFDKLSHELLLIKLNRFGFSNKLISLVRSYLGNRYLYV